MFRPSLLTAAVCAALYTPAFAQQTNTTTSIELNPITVSSSREYSPLNKLANNITVINDKTLENHLALSVEDALESVPGVSFDGQGRYGLSDVTIRGVSGNRVKLLVDGQEIANYFSFGPFQTAGRQYLDLNNMKQVEIIKGPASSLHGSDAVGGVVSFISKTPDDYLQADKRFGGSVGASYHGDSNTFAQDATLAFALSPQWDGLVSLGFSQGHERENHHGNDAIGASRSSPNPEDNKSHNIQGQLRFKPNENHTFSLKVSDYRFEHDSQMLNQLKIPFSRRNIYSYDTYRAENEQKRQSLALRHDFTIHQAWADSGYWQIFAQKQASQQNSIMNGVYTNTVPNLGLIATNAAAQRWRQSDYEVKEIGGELQLHKHIAGNISQDWVYGINIHQKEIEMLRTGNDQINTSNQSISERNAPNSEVQQIGVFAQNRLSFGDSGFSLIPGIRYDRYRLKTSPDAIFNAGAGRDFAINEFDEGKFSFRLGALYDINEQHSLYANYAEGFRAPNFSEANVGFANYARGYAYIPNLNLKPESSRGIELGWRSDNGIFHHDLSLYYNRYKNFIKTQHEVGFNRATRLIQYQSINLPSAEIYGAELGAGLDFGAMNPQLEGFSADIALAYAKGNTKGKDSSGASAKIPLTQINPLSGYLRLQYDAPSDIWGVAGKWHFARGKSANDIATTDHEGKALDSPRAKVVPLPTGGYGVFDLTGYYRPIPDLTVRAGIFNAFDKAYIPWSDAKTLSNSRDQQIYSAPGRWFGASIRYDF